MCCAGAAPLQGAYDERGAGIALAVRGRQEEGIGHVAGGAQGIHLGRPPVAGGTPGACTPHRSGERTSIGQKEQGRKQAPDNLNTF